MDLHDQIIGDPWKESIVLSSVPLWKYENKIPIAVASGCLIRYKKNIFIVSIAHASIAESEWNIEVKGVEKVNGKFGTIFQPVNMQALSEFRLIPEKDDFTEPKIVDFTYRQLPNDFCSKHCIAILNENEILESDRTIFTTDFLTTPSKGKKYGFYGKVKFKGVDGQYMDFKHRLETDLEYVGIEGEFFKFRLSHKYGSHANYLGCSGAPIIDEDNNVVALVSFGRRSTNCIYGIDITKYRAALDVELIN